MKPRNGAVIALVFLATCSEESRDPGSSNIESARAALGKSPPTEIATWQKAGSSSTPDGRYLQAAAFDETRKVFVMFGGVIYNTSTYSSTPNQETWEWNPATGKWTNRTGTSAAPLARSGAAMVFDSVRNKMVLFGGRAGSGSNFEDTWDWDPLTFAWTDVTSAGSHPSARSQHGMVYEKSTGKIFLFGGGRSDLNSYDGTGMTISLGDAWELDPTTRAWALLPIKLGPTARHDMGLVWDGTRNKAVLFGGMQMDIPNASGVPKQDTWEWDPAAGTWTELTALGSKPTQRYGHAMAFDGSRGRAVLFGGWDMSTGGSLGDLWDWDPTTGAWTQRLTGTEGTGPSPRMYASLVSNDTVARLELVAGAATYDPYGKNGTGGSYIGPMPGPVGIGYYGFTGSREVWELDPVPPTFTDRTAPLDVPSMRTSHAMAYNPTTGKTYMFGGYDSMSSQPLDDLWEWNGTTWAQVTADVRPPARADAAMAYDPARKSLILFGGTSYYGSSVYNETWEWSSTRGWTQLTPASSPDALYSHGMVTDTSRGKILLFGGISNYYYYYGPDGGAAGGAPMKDPMRNEVWEWDGAKITWTNRTPTTSSQVPSPRQYPTLAFDDGRQKMFLYDGYNYNYNTGASSSAFWEWDTTSAGWALRDPGDGLDSAYYIYAVYDPTRRREILFTDTSNYTGGTTQTWELDARGPTWYVRTPASSPAAHYNSAMAFDSARGVAVLFGGVSNSTGTYSNETWEYKVTGWGNGEGCTAATVASCASGNCVNGVCCESAACTGPCKSCNVAGSEGSCVPAKAGTEVAGSCSNGQACDGVGNCMSGNGQACTSAAACASGNCVDGVCCDSACTAACSSCAIAGRAGKCSPYTAGTDPQNECGKGTGVCKSTCDGVGACVFPSSGMTCASCTVCDGVGTCGAYDPYCGYYGTGGYYGGSGGYYGYGGTQGYGGTKGPGGSGGYATSKGGAGGAGGYSTSKGGAGGSGGYNTGVGGAAGSGGTTNRGGSGGYSTGLGGSGGFVIGPDGSAGVPGGGSGGKADSGNPVGGVGGQDPDAGGLSTARLHRSGCSCEVGSAGHTTAPALTIPLFIAGLAVLRRVRRRRR